MIAMFHRHKHRLPAIIWACLLFTLSSFPGRSVPSLGFEYEDLAAHFLVYAVFGYLLALACGRHQAARDLRRIALAVVLGAVYAFSDELHQAFVPGRVTSMSDLAADVTGLLVGALLFRWYPFGLQSRRPEMLS
jgi:VanZ family protein